MGKINVLDAQVANLIAAGEVVDRPASVVKELVENSIDAHAKHITVEIQSGGVRYMRVSDDGTGIASEDMPLALKRHATSKISAASDLSAICTLGFRGEALAAISSVSKVRILSKTPDSKSGTMLYADGGEILEVRESGCPNGTTITIEELLANVPARRKFLKKDATEAAAVCAAVEKIALSHPEIAFRLISDGALKLESAGDGKLEHTIFSVMGKDFAKRILAVKCRSEGIDVYGYIGTSDNVKPTRNFENFFINHRYVKSRTAMAALEQAFNSYIAPERFPCCVLFIDIDPGAVDVNVHPAKLEVKFSNERLVFDTVYYAVRNTLESNTTRPQLVLRSPDVRPHQTVNAFVPVLDRSDRQSYMPEQIRMDASVRAHAPAEQIKKDFASAVVHANPESKADALSAPASAVTVPRFVPKIEPYPAPAEEEMPVATKTVSESVANTGKSECGVEKLPLPVYRIIGVAFNTYIFVEVADQVIVIDKHAAHERILFEGMRGQIRGFTPAPQMLLVPITVGLSKHDFGAVLEYSDSFREIGFDFEADEAENRVRITQIPSAIQIGEVEDLFATLADRLASGTGNAEVTKQDAYEKALYQASCKAAMKGGRQDSESDVRYVVEKILTIPDITVCPHGRPVVMHLTKHMLDRQFGRE